VVHIETSCQDHTSACAAQRIGSPAADYSQTTDSENRFLYQMAEAEHAEGGQVETVLGGLPSRSMTFQFHFSLLLK
jgi:hypothetical protein